jgi:hypothetical protein
MVFNQLHSAYPWSLSTSGDAFGCHIWGGGDIGILWIKTRDVAEYPNTLGGAQPKHGLAQDVNSIKCKKFGFLVTYYKCSLCY